MRFRYRVSDFVLARFKRLTHLPSTPPLAPSSLSSLPTGSSRLSQNYDPTCRVPPSWVRDCWVFPETLQGPVAVISLL